jgi:hypothetical protein
MNKINGAEVYLPLRMPKDIASVNNAIKSTIEYTIRIYRYFDLICPLPP